jgi:soluble cytochrome b562
MKKSSQTVKEESTICPMTDDVKKLLIETLDAKIRELTEAREALVSGTGFTETGATLSQMTHSSTTALPKKSHVSQEAKDRLSQRMRLVWAVRKAQSQGHRVAIKEAKEALEAWDRDNPKK